MLTWSITLNSSQIPRDREYLIEEQCLMKAMVGRGGIFCLMNIEFQFRKMKNILKMDGGEICKTVCAESILLNSTYKSG